MDGSIRIEFGQLESPANADATCVLVDLLDDVLVCIMLSSLVSHVVVGWGLSRNVAFARCFPLQDVGECTRTCVHGADAPQVASARQFLFRPLGLGVQTHFADGSPGSVGHR